MNIKIDWWLIGICISRVTTGLVFITFAAALPVLREEWGLSASAGGSIVSGHNLGYALSLVIFSSLADILGPRIIFLGSMLAGGVSSLAFAFLARDYYSALILYTMVGLALGGTYTTGLMLLTDHYPVQRRGMAMGFFIASTSLGYALSLVITGLSLPVGGYKLSFLLTCAGPALGCLVSWITLWRTRVAPVKREKQQAFKRSVLANRPAMLLIGGYTFHNWELLGMWAWTPAFLAVAFGLAGHEPGRAAGLGAYLTASFHLTGLVASFTMGVISDRLGRTRVLTILASLSAGCSFFFGWTLGAPLGLVIGLGLIYAFTALGDSPVLSAALTEVVEPRYLGAAYGLRSLTGFTAGSLAPLAVGAVLDLLAPSSATPTPLAWGLAFSVLGLSGLGAAVSAHLYGRWRAGR
jgi:MFS family permease